MLRHTQADTGVYRLRKRKKKKKAAIIVIRRE